MKSYEVLNGGMLNKSAEIGTGGEIDLFADIINNSYKEQEEKEPEIELSKQEMKWLENSIEGIRVLKATYSGKSLIAATTNKGDFLFVNNKEHLEIFEYNSAMYADLGGWKLTEKKGEMTLVKDNINTRIFKSTEKTAEKKLSKTLFSGDENAVKWLGRTNEIASSAIETAKTAINIKSTTNKREASFEVFAELSRMFPIDYSSDLHYVLLCNYKEYSSKNVIIKERKVSVKDREVTLNLPYAYNKGEKVTEAKRCIPTSLQLSLRKGDVRTGLVVITDVPIGNTNMLGGPIHSRYYERRIGLKAGYSPKLFFGHDKTKGQSCVANVTLNHEMPIELQDNFFCGVDGVLSVHEIEKDSYTAEVKSNLLGLINLSKKIAKESKLSEYSWKVEINVNGRVYTGLMLLTVIINDHLHGSYVNKITKDSDFYYASMLEKVLYGKNTYKKADSNKRALSFINSNFTVKKSKEKNPWSFMDKAVEI